MTDAILYWRTPTTRADQYTVANLTSNQKLTFTVPDNILSSIQFSYQNNVLDIPVPNSNAVRRINKQENGLRSIRLIISGRFKKPLDGSGDPMEDTDIQKLIDMSKMSQVDASHPYGIIGFYSPNAPEFSLDPNATGASAPATKGYTIESWDLGYMSPKITAYDFRVVLSFGGTW
jgi:hypothetical protein